VGNIDEIKRAAMVRTQSGKVKRKAFASCVSRNSEREAVLRRIVPVKYSSHFIFLLATTSITLGQVDPKSREMNQPVPPFRIAGNQEGGRFCDAAARMIASGGWLFKLDG
jgi:hypothetical protein